MAADNKLLGQFDLVGIPPAPRGMPQIEVTFDIDANGIVNVSAKDKATAKEQQIRIQASGGLSDADIDRMVKDAEAHSADDKKRKGVVESRNRGDHVIHEVEKQLKEHGDKVAASERSAIENAVADLRKAMEGEDAELMKAKADAALQASYKLGEAIYKSQQGGASGSGSSGGSSGNGAKPGGKDEKVVDADFEEVNENRKGGAA
jgi:molecular chaperone DnaK